MAAPQHITLASSSSEEASSEDEEPRAAVNNQAQARVPLSSARTAIQMLHVAKDVDIHSAACLCRTYFANYRIPSGGADASQQQNIDACYAGL